VVAVRANFNTDFPINATRFEEKLERLECKIYYRTSDDDKDKSQDFQRSGLMDGKARVKTTRIVENMRYEAHNYENAFENEV
jgi:hypothetical protein